MFKVRKQHFVNLKYNLQEMMGQNDELSEQNTMSRQQVMPTKTVSFKKVKDCSPPRYSPRANKTMANSPVKQISFKQFVTTRKFNNISLDAECLDYKQEREAKIERALLI